MANPHQVASSPQVEGHLALQIPEDNRAQILYKEFERRFLASLHDLPTPASQAALNEATYSGRAESQPLTSLLYLNPALVGLPWLFWEEFSDVGDEDFLNASQAGAFYVLSTVIMDHWIDNQGTQSEEKLLCIQSFQATAFRMFQRLFGQESIFWSDFYRLQGDHIQGIATEMKVLTSPGPVRREAFWALTGGKVAPMIMTILALCTLSGSDSAVIPQMEKALRYVSIGSQMLDDIEDWSSDLGQKHFTYFLSLVTQEHDWSEGTWPSEAEVQSEINRGWSDVANLQMAISWLEGSLGAVSSIESTGWDRYAKAYIKLADDHATAATAKHLRRTIKPLVQENTVESDLD